MTCNKPYGITKKPYQEIRGVCFFNLCGAVFWAERGGGGSSEEAECRTQRERMMKPAFGLQKFVPDAKPVGVGLQPVTSLQESRSGAQYNTGTAFCPGTVPQKGKSNT